MLKQIYLTYVGADGQPADAFSITLGSEDGSYGIRRRDTGEVVVPYGQGVTHASTGSYTYEFNPLPGVIYDISWMVVPQSSESPTWVIESLGPLPDTGSTRSVADFRGTFVQSTLGTVFLRITQFDGQAIDPEQISITITDHNGQPVRDDSGKIFSAEPVEKIATGFYYADWAIPLNQPVGLYNVTWTYTADGTPGSEYQSIKVAAATQVDPQTLYAGYVADARAALAYMLAIAQYVPVYGEPARKTDNSFQNYGFTFPRWNQSTRCTIYVNREPVTDGITINYFKGSVSFDKPLTQFDVVEADYNFRWFSDEELDTFLSNAIGRYNTTPLFTRQGWNNIPPDWYNTILDMAASYAIRNLMMRLLTMEAKLVFGGPEAAREMFGNLETIKKNYEEQAKEQLDKKKLGPYKGLTRFVSVPEYTLPGGRSRMFRYMFSGGS